MASVWHDRHDWLTRLFAARKFRTSYPKNARLVALRRNTHILCEKIFCVKNIFSGCIQRDKTYSSHS